MYFSIALSLKQCTVTVLFPPSNSMLTQFGWAGLHVVNNQVQDNFGLKLALSSDVAVVAVVAGWNSFTACNSFPHYAALTSCTVQLLLFRARLMMMKSSVIPVFVFFLSSHWCARWYGSWTGSPLCVGEHFVQNKMLGWLRWLICLGNLTKAQVYLLHCLTKYIGWFCVCRIQRA